MDNGRDRVSIGTKFNYGLGSLGINLTAGLFGAWTLNFYIKIVGIDPLLWVLAWIFYMVWNAINDLIFGYLSDKTRTKYGRRIPFLMVCGPLLSISFILIYFTPENSEQWVYFVWLLITLISYDTFFTIVGLCFAALLSELTIEPKERASMNFFGAIGGGIAIGVTYIIPFLLIQNIQPFSQNRPVFQVIVVFLAIFGAFFLAFTAFGIKERPELWPEPEENLALWKATKTTLKNKSFVTFIIFNFTMAYLQTAIMSNLPFYMQDVLKIEGNDIFSSMPLILFVSCSMIGFPLGLYLNNKIGGKKAIFYLSFVVIIGLVMVTFANGILLANISFAVLGLGFSGQLLLSFTLLADVVDEDELKTGVRREGAYFGANALITKPAQSLSAGLVGLVFFLTFYNQNLSVGEAQPESAIFGIKLLIGLIPAIFIAIGLIAFRFYPLDASKEEYKEMKRQVSILHDKKLERLRKKLAILKEKNE